METSVEKGLASHSSINSNCTIAWHVNGLKVSHKDEAVVKQVIQLIEEENGEMSVNIRGKIIICQQARKT